MSHLIWIYTIAKEADLVCWLKGLTVLTESLNYDGIADNVDPGLSVRTLFALASISYYFGSNMIY